MSRGYGRRPRDGWMPDNVPHLRRRSAEAGKEGRHRSPQAKTATEMVTPTRPNSRYTRLTPLEAFSWARASHWRSRLAAAAGVGP
jgi:hypothetical protein